MVDKSTAWEGGYAAISNFGFGGSNVHMLLHGKAHQQGRRVISLTAEDASLAPAPMPLSNPTATSELDCIIPLAARTPDGMARLAKALQVSMGHR